MKNIIYLLIIVLTSLQCQSGRTVKNRVKVNPNNFEHTENDAVKEISSIDVAQIEGVWAENKDENAAFWIENDSLYSVENSEDVFKVEISNDTLIVYYDGMATYDAILKLTTDSLILKNEFDIIIRLYKRK